jgi:hypothetical protein
MPEILVLAVDPFHRRLDRHIVLRSIVQGIAPATNGPFAPRRNDAQPWVERHDGQLEANLVVALAGRAVGDSVRTFQLGNLNHPPGNQRACKRSPQQIFAFVDGPSLQSGKDIVGEKFQPQILDVDLAGARGQCLFLQSNELVGLP